MSAPADGAGTTVVARPRKVRRLVIPVAALVLIVCTVAGIFLQNSTTGVFFTVSDQVAMVGIGAVLAGIILLPMRPRMRADESGIEVRNTINTHHYTWPEVEGVSFPDGAGWARVDLPDDEYEPILAIQAFDGEHAVRAMRELRELRRHIGHIE
ncbi:PH (Pleckstrin Homology) domain-containing protein [Halopolyspora algeriensis]|uniref:PH (Pleckstrin Homology) domain-containing protein n=1 Tax=Halopolyspora algeriensis TaxID=1500506 RepID=A0A368VGG0_9ACTN|nr:PH domain-containing protein [Halopolyspora algeriensis]RCW40370.1 PH (Pleckstrin Homology) domain-containing protein [Halopolyspora algeriensis]TQM53654.1 PH (Pleckstrin Homology) domain-containing protein [Halopolyspora algeriensis]